MIVSIYLPLVLPVLVVPMVRWLCGRLHPALASWLAVVSGLVLCFCAFVVLALLMFVSLSTLSVFARFRPLVPRPRLQELDLVKPAGRPGGRRPADGVRHGPGIVVAPAAAARTGQTHTGRHDGVKTAASLTVVVDERPLAHALPGRPGAGSWCRRACWPRLTPAERRALLAHEAGAPRSAPPSVRGGDRRARRGQSFCCGPLAGTIRFTTETLGPMRSPPVRLVTGRWWRGRLVGPRWPVRGPSGGNCCGWAATAGAGAAAGDGPGWTAPPVVSGCGRCCCRPVGLFTLVVLGLVVGSAHVLPLDAAYDLRRALMEAKA